MLKSGLKHLSTWNYFSDFYLEIGYKHIDTARRYGVEQFIGKAVKDSGIDRSELFLSTKLWPNEYGQGKAKKGKINFTEK